LPRVGALGVLDDEMSVTRSGEPENPRKEGMPSHARGALWRGFQVAAVAGILCVLLIALGFAWFVWRLPAEEVQLRRNADGIVVLTGGSSRIADAIELLAAGRGKRLLISGVHPSTRPGEIARSMPDYQQMFACCIDLDHSARNTQGNALETRRWVSDRGFRSLIVVTSNYHMPRAMAELGRQLPGVTLIAFPVVPERQRGDPWWARGATAKLLLSEYVKYVAAMLNIRLDRKAVSEPSGQSSARADSGSR
jgi:uncharacterized SAM-binding protein YcdF (DUF218 family)